MKSSKIRIASLLTALIMVLAMTTALAEAPKAPTLADIFDNSGNVAMEAQITINPQAIGMLAGFTGAQADEAGMSQLTAIVNAVNKLRGKVVANKTGASGALGTANGDLLDFQMTYNEETFANQFTSTLLPGLALSMDPAFLQKNFAQATQAQQMTPEQALQLIAPYGSALTKYLDSIAPQLVKEEGSFAVEPYGTFTSKTPFTLTSHMLADLMQALADVYKTDEGLKNYIQQSMQAAQSTMAEVEALPQSAQQDPGQAMEDAAKDLKAKDDAPLLVGTLYENPNGIYIDAVTTKSEQGQTKVDLFIDDSSGNTKVNAKITLKSAPMQGEEVSAEPINWAELEQQITSGQNYTDTLLVIDAAATTQEPSITSNLNFSIIMSGINIGATVNSVSRTDKLEGNSTISLSLMSPEPLLTLAFNVTQTEDAPVAPALDGTTAVTITEGEIKEADQQLLNASLEKALPELMQRLNTVLPEEGPAILKLLQDVSTQGQPAPATAP